MRAMGIIRNLGHTRAPQLTLPVLTVAAALALALAATLSGCTNVVTYTQPTLVRVIDASYNAPALNVFVEGNLLAGNIGQGTITPYGTLTASTAAPIKLTAPSSTTALLTSSGIFLAGHQHSILIADNAAAPNQYALSVLEDQQIAAAAGHSAFRFLNQASRSSAIDIYLVPTGSNLLSTYPVVTNLAAGAASGYITFTAQTVAIVVTPTGLTTGLYTSTPIALTGGEVRTVLFVDNHLTTTPAIQAVVANDVN